MDLHQERELLKLSWLLTNTSFYLMPSTPSIVGSYLSESASFCGYSKVHRGFISEPSFIQFPSISDVSVIRKLDLSYMQNTITSYDAPANVELVDHYVVPGSVPGSLGFIACWQRTALHRSSFVTVTPAKDLLVVKERINNAVNYVEDAFAKEAYLAQIFGD